jgi:hypothetical protein
MDVESRLGRLLRLLQGSIRAAGLTQTEVDGRIGRRRGYLSHVFQRRVDLKLVDLLSALEVLQIDAGRFFRAAFCSREDERAPVEDLMQLVSELRPTWPPAPREPTDVHPLTVLDEDSRLLERVREVVRTILDERHDEPAFAAGGRRRNHGN